MIDLWFGADICGFTEFAQLTALPVLAEDFGPGIGDRLIGYRKLSCAAAPA
ncbi:hypothetical protein [Caulobacter sp.]|uniref:hypothetical protein n=1 Tax=Caulobacter sp. TaxID=78 RepID=UPI0031D87EAD